MLSETGTGTGVWQKLRLPRPRHLIAQLVSRRPFRSCEGIAISAVKRAHFAGAKQWRTRFLPVLSEPKEVICAAEYKERCDVRFHMGDLVLGHSHHFIYAVRRYDKWHG